MEPLSEATLLDIWDAGGTLGYHQRALLLLRLGEPETAVEHWLDIPVGRSNDALLRLHQRMFGDHLTSVAACPDCDQLIESSVAIDDLLAQGKGPGSGTVFATVDGVRVPCRLPTPRDVGAVIGAGTDAEAATALLARCIGDTERPVDTDRLSPEAWERIEQALSAADPLASIGFLLQCEACDRRWEAPFDVVSFLWEACSARAGRLLVQVHSLASAYHWTEASILRMSQRRRRFYLECIGT